MAKEKFIQKMHMKKGALHEALGVPQGEKIPQKKMQKALHSDNPTMHKRAVLAETLSHLSHRHHDKSRG